MEVTDKNMMKKLILSHTPYIDKIQDYNSAEGINTSVLIANLYFTIYNIYTQGTDLKTDSQFIDKENNLLLKIQKRYEVTKNVSAFYSNTWKSIGNNEVSAESYFDLLLMLLVFYNETSDIRFLNTGFKIIDRLKHFTSLNIPEVENIANKYLNNIIC